MYLSIYLSIVCIYTQAKLPELFKLDVVRRKFNENITPTTVVLLQELERFNKLIRRMSLSLSNLQKVCLNNKLLHSFIHLSIHLFIYSQALAGEVGMSNELDELARSLYNGQLPSIWRALAPATLKSLGNWMSHFLRRNEQYKSWVCLTHPFIHF